MPQSAYRARHRTETALLKVHNDILLNMDNQRVTLLVLLDLSSAFMKYLSVVLRYVWLSRYCTSMVQIVPGW